MKKEAILESDQTVVTEQTSSKKKIKDGKDRIRIRMIALFIFTLLFSYFSFVFMAAIPNVMGIPFFMAPEYYWCFYLFLPIPLFSLILGIKYKKQGIKCQKNIVVGCIFIILFLLFGRLSLDFHLNCKATYQDLVRFQDIVEIEIPSSGKYRQLSFDTTDTTGTVETIETMNSNDKIYIAKFKNDAETKEFEHQLIQNKNWVLSKDYSFSMRDSLPIFLASELSLSEDTYCLTYVEKENLYNILPTGPGEYRLSTCVYHMKNHYLMCGEYSYLVVD